MKLKKENSKIKIILKNRKEYQSELKENLYISKINFVYKFPKEKVRQSS
jgi:hypothetical protein